MIWRRVFFPSLLLQNRGDSPCLYIALNNLAHVVCVVCLNALATGSPARRTADYSHGKFEKHVADENTLRARRPYYLYSIAIEGRTDGGKEFTSLNYLTFS